MPAQTATRVGPSKGVGRPDAGEGDPAAGQQGADFAVDTETNRGPSEQEMNSGEAEDPGVESEVRLAFEDDATGKDDEDAAAEEQQPGRDRKRVVVPASQLVAERRSGVEDPEPGQDREHEQNGFVG